MKVNIGGEIVNLAEAQINLNNRAFFYGDSVKEVLRLANGIIVDWENHYFSLMATMRIFRMNIPLSFTPDFFTNQINLLAQSSNLLNGKITFFVYRNTDSNLSNATINFAVKIESSEKPWIYYNTEAEIDVYKDYYVNTSFYSLQNTPHPEEYIAQVYCQENEYEDLILLNSDKRMARTLRGNIFVLKDNILKTPKSEEGVIKSVLRDRFIKEVNTYEEFSVEETDIFPFEIQRADEVFVLINGEGILSITQNRKKTYTTSVTNKLFNIFFKD